MKHIKLSEEFFTKVSDVGSILESTMNFSELKDKYLDNPYGLGASSIELDETSTRSTLIIKCKTIHQRQGVETKLKRLGVPAKLISRATADKAYAYRYKLYVNEK